MVEDEDQHFQNPQFTMSVKLLPKNKSVQSKDTEIKKNIFKLIVNYRIAVKNYRYTNIIYRYWIRP